MTYDFTKSRDVFERVSKLIPLGSQTFSKSHLQYPENAPLFISHGKGAHVWDVDGNEYVDMVNGLLSVILGYCDVDVDTAIAQQLKKGISFSLATELELQLAGRLVKHIPSAEMVRFGKNGSDVTSAAIRLARAYTGRNKIAVCGYHGWHDWYIGSTTMNKGVPEECSQLTCRFEYNNIESLVKLIDSNPGQIAAVILEPMNVSFPENNFLHEVRELCTKNGIVLVFDEIITGFRCDLGGAQKLFDVTPDLSTFGKSMGNGMPISALVGKFEIMQLLDRIFFSSTFGGEALSLAAAIAVIDKIESCHVPADLARKGRYLEQMISELISNFKLENIIKLTGLDSWKLLIIDDDPNTGISRGIIKYIFISQMLENGVLIQASHNLSYAHTDSDLEKVVNAYKIALRSIANLLEAQPNKITIEAMNKIAPVFSVR